MKRDEELGSALRDLPVPEREDDFFFQRLTARLEEEAMEDQRSATWQLVKWGAGIAAAAVVVVAAVVLTSGSDPLPGVDPAPVTATNPDDPKPEDDAEHDSSDATEPAPTPPPQSAEDATAAARAAGAVAHYPLEDGFDSVIEGAPALESIGDVELVADEAAGGSAPDVALDEGFRVETAGLLDPEVYTIVFRFHLDTSLNSFQYRKLIDFTDLAHPDDDPNSDFGFYAQRNQFTFYGVIGNAGTAPAGGPPYTTVALRRAEDGTLALFQEG
ncbi:MAG: hypothetical protein R3320_10945, partial [Nitriliruptorales bacterium]|nr:hypothetical protein [Nitriliruptorales bacterium]